MGLTNRDSSVLTMKRRGMAENSYYTQWKAATMNTSTPMQGVTAPAKVSAEVISEITLGCSTCTAIAGTDPNMRQYPFNPSSGGAGRGY
jgi:hypothetical protein